MSFFDDVVFITQFFPIDLKYHRTFSRAHRATWFFHMTAIAQIKRAKKNVAPEKCTKYISAHDASKINVEFTHFCCSIPAHGFNCLKVLSTPKDHRV